MDLFELSIAGMHVLSVIFLTLIISTPFFTNVTKRTITMISISVILSVLLGIVFESLVPTSIDNPIQYLVPILLISVITLVFLLLEKDQYSEKEDRPKFNNLEEINKRDKRKRRKKEEERIIESVAWENYLQRVDDDKKLFIGEDGLILYLETKNSEILANLWYYYFEKKNSKYRAGETKTLERHIQTVGNIDLELISQIYKPELFKEKYPERIVKHNVEQLFKELPENKTKNGWLDSLHERASLIALIKDPGILLPDEWLIIKFHHQIIYPENYNGKTRMLPILLEEGITRFRAVAENITEMYLQDFNKIQASTEYGKTSLIFLHKYDLPPLHHLVRPDEEFLDNYFQRELTKTEEIYEEKHVN